MNRKDQEARDEPLGIKRRHGGNLRSNRMNEIEEKSSSHAVRVAATQGKLEEVQRLVLP